MARVKVLVQLCRLGLQTKDGFSVSFVRGYMARVKMLVQLWYLGLETNH